MNDLLTDLHPEPVIASKLRRVGAALIDLIILLIAGYIISIVSGQSENFKSEGGEGFKVGFNLTGLPAFLLWVVWLLLLPVMEAFSGQTIGKKILKLKVVKQDFSPATLSTTLVRHIFDIIDIIFFIGLLVAASNNKNQRIGDLVAKSIVVEKLT